MSAAARSSSRSTARSPGPGASWRPTSWSSKYFYGDVASGNGSPADGKREYSVRQLVNRVTRTIADWGKEDGYFATAEDAERFYDELTALCLNQYGSFNSPVWFNVGLFHRYGINGPANNYRWDEETRAIAQGRRRLPVPAGLGLLHPERQRRHGRASCGWRPARPCSSSSARGPAPTSRPSAPARRSSPAAASRRGPSASCGSTTPSPRRQVGRQDPPRRQDADPQVLAPRHPRVHRVQDQGGAEGPGADPRRLRGQLQRRGLQLGHVPERQPLGPLHRRLPPRRRGRRGMDHPRRHHRPAHADLQGQDAPRQDRRRHLALRRPRHAVRGHHPALAHLPEYRADQFIQSLLANTCSSTIRRAIWRRST